MRLAPRSLVAALVWTATACGGGGMEPTVGAPAQITVVSGSGLTEMPGSTLPTLSVKVGDHAGNPVPDVTVTWTVTAGGGSLDSATTTTDANGRATNIWTLGSAGGGTVNTVSATVTGASGTITPAMFTARAGVQLVAQASINPAGFGWPVLAVEIQGQSIPLMLFLGVSGNGMSPTVLNGLSGSGGSLTTQIGTVTQSLTFQSVGGNFAGGAAVGYLGGPTLAHFDWVENSSSVSLYTQLSQPTTQPAWLPSGMTVADCMSMQTDAYQGVYFPTRVNGISLHSWFNTGARRTNLNLAALTALGLDTLSPNVHPVTFSAGLGNELAKWEVTGLTIAIGTHALAADSATVYSTMGYNTAEFDLGTETFNDRTLVLSYSSKNVCIGQP